MSATTLITVLIRALGLLAGVSFWSVASQNSHLVAQSRPTSPQSQPTPQVHDDGDRLKLLMQNPDDLNLWTEELKRQEAEGIELAERKLGLVALTGRVAAEREPGLELAIANNHQRQGISMRHLKRYQDALSQFSESQVVLDDLERGLQCDYPSAMSVCNQIREQYHLLYEYSFYVYFDLNDDANIKKYARLALDSVSNSAEYSLQVRNIIYLYQSRGQYDRTLDMVFDAIEQALTRSKQEEVLGASQIASQLLRELFTTISWIPETGKRRSNDPRDFADSHGLGIGRPFRYGMTSPAEDHATFATVFYTQEQVARSADDPKSRYRADNDGYASWEELEVNVDVEGYVRAQLADNNFEPAAKYLYFKYLHTRFYCPPGDWTRLRNTPSYCKSGAYPRCPVIKTSDVTFSEVMKKLSETPLSRVDANTSHIIDLLYHAYDWLSRHCLDQ